MARKPGEAIGADCARGDEIGNRRAQLLVAEIAGGRELVGERGAVRAEMVEDDAIADPEVVLARRRVAGRRAARH